MPSGPPGTRAATPARRGGALLAWIAILGVVAWIVLRNETAERDPAAAARAAHALLRLQAESALGAAVLSGGADARHALESLDASPVTGPVSLRLRRAVVRAEARSREAAGAVLAVTRREAEAAGVAFTEEETRAAALLEERWSRDADASPAEREALRRALGWFGDLAGAPRGPGRNEDALLRAAESKTILLMLAAVGFALLLLTSLAVAGVAVWSIATGRAGPPPDPPASPSWIAAETFAVWLVLYVALSFAVEALGGGIGAGAGAMAASAAAAFLWPGLRGGSAGALLRDAGFGRTGSVVREALAGVAAWIASLPLLVAGVLAAAILEGWRQAGAPDAGAFELPAGPFHPATDDVARGDVALVAFAACVVAPIVEETMFRGLLFGDLRTRLGRLPRWVAAAGAGVASALVFALLHPQGWTFAPALASLGTGFALAREWRGGLAAPVAAHALHNGLTVGMAALLLPAA